MAFTANPVPGESKTTWPTKVINIFNELKALADRNNANYTHALNADNVVDGNTNKVFTAEHKLAVEAFGGAYSVSGSLVGGVAIDSWTGTDDARVTSAMSYASTQPFPVPIIFGSRQYTLNTVNRACYGGMKWIGGYGFGNHKRNTITVPNDIKFNGNGVLFTMSGEKMFDLEFCNLSFTGNSNGQFMETGSTVLWTSYFHNLGFNLWKHVFGNPSAKLLVTAVCFDGWWNINNGYNTAMTIGGSDNNFWNGGMCLLDSPPGTITAGVYHFICDYLEKTHIGPMFITCEGAARGVKVMGNSGTVALIFSGAGRCEGRNSGLGCHGNNFRIDGHGGTTIRDWWISYGMISPNTNGLSGEIALVTVTGSAARVLADGVQSGRANGKVEADAIIGQTGGYVRCVNMRAEEAQSQAFTPGRLSFLSTGGTYSIDSSCTDRSSDAPARKIAL